VTKEYKDFLLTKLDYGKTEGLSKIKIHEKLFDFQKVITEWTCKKGRAANFADTGLGKTFMQVVFAQNIVENTNGKVIIFAPLSVNEQTIEEAEKLSIKITRFDIGDNNKIKICNYENLEKLNHKDYSGIILDESSILKSINSKTRERLIKFSQFIKYRGAYTATPAPNDIAEIANHAEFLGIMKREEMLSKFFFNNGEEWTIKGHGIESFYKWMATWAMFIKYPADLGFENNGFKLPKLIMQGEYFDYEFKKEGTLFDIGFSGIGDRIKIRKDTIIIKSQRIADKINNQKTQSIIWCGLNEEAVSLNRLIPASENLQGSDSEQEKIRKIKEFKKGKIRVLITKPKIAGFGLNFQNCFDVHFFGLSDSYEAYYQCIRRCYRFGQKKQVAVTIWLAGNEKIVLSNVKHKEEVSEKISREVIKHVKIYEQEEISGQKHFKEDFMENLKETENYKSYLGDSIETWKAFKENSIDFMVFSPPFSSLYTYSASQRDLGNCRTDEEFYKHFGFLIKELFRTLKPGRLCAVHCMDIPTRLINAGYIGIRDFSGSIIRAFEKERFYYHSRITIQKNPQAAAIRTHAKGLLFKQMHKDSSWSRQGLPDYVCVFRKPGENEIEIKPDIDNDDWIKWAHPIWTDIRETHTLNARSTKSEKDEKHICPLQLDVIERCIRLWSNKGEVIASPFSGVGSEGYMAIKLERKALLCELKKEYWEQGLKNLEKAEKSKIDLFTVNSEAVV